MLMSLSTRLGHRKSAHAALIARIDTTPRIGRDIGSTIDQNSRKVPAPSVRAASKISRGRLSKNRVTSSTLNALAPAGSQHRPEGVDERGPDERRMQDRQVERHQEHDGWDEQRRQHGAATIFPYLGRSTEST